MLTIPDRLLDEVFVTLFYRSPRITLLQKQIVQSLSARSSYLAQHVITMVTAGEQRIRAYDGETMTVRAGQMGAIRRGLYTITDLATDGDGFTAYLLFFDDEQLSQAFPATLSSPTASIPLYRFNTPNYMPVFWQSVAALHATLPNHLALANIKIDEFFTALKASEVGPTLAKQLATWTAPTPRNIRQFMEANFDKPLTVEDYAYLTGRSESTFRRDFKARFGTTPRRWIIRQRLEKAHQLLSTTTWDVTQVALEVGYDNVSHFISAFKKQYQRTPGQKSQRSETFDRKAAS
ncbi:MAG: AraC family transcriptional regulator [Tunicatimonas sp.]